MQDDISQSRRKHIFKSGLGLSLYGAAAVFLGVLGLVWTDFATNWQRVGPAVPHRPVLADLTAVIEIVLGAAVLLRRTARLGALLLAVLYAVFAGLWVIQIAAAPQTYDSWGNFFEESSLVIAGLAAFAALSPPASAWAHRTGAISRLYGICVISFGVVHCVYFAGAASYVPRWLPPGQRFWVAATAVCFFLAAAAILSGVFDRLAARLLTAEIVGFEILVWIPRLIASPHDHFVWAGNGISLAMAGAVWVVADGIAAKHQAAPVKETVSA